MRYGRCPHKEERLRGVVAYPALQLVIHQVAGVLLLVEFVVTAYVIRVCARVQPAVDGHILVAGGDLFVVFPQIVGVVGVRQHLAVETVEVVEAAVAWRRAGAGASEPPLADHSRGITRVGEHCGERCGAFGKGPLPFEVRVLVDGVEVPVGFAKDHSFRAGPALVVASYLAVAAVEAGHHAAARWSGQGSGGVHIREHNAAGGQGVDIRGLYEFLSVAAQVAVAQVVEH